MEKLSFVRDVTVVKAKFDPIYLVKRDMMDACLILEKAQKWGYNYLPLLKNHQVLDYTKSRIRQYYRHMQTTLQFDNHVALILKRRAKEQREDFYLMQYDEDIMRRINRIPIRPKILMPPLTYSGSNITTLFHRPFYGRIEIDPFGHLTIVLRQRGEELYFGIRRDPMPYEFYPSFTHPFASEYRLKDVNRVFKEYGRTFTESYEIMKGLFTLWYQFQF